MVAFIITVGGLCGAIMGISLYEWFQKKQEAKRKAGENEEDV